MQNNHWNDESVLDFLKTNPSFQSFINGELSAIIYNLHEITFLIYREGTNVSFYYASPFYPKLDYSLAEDFFSCCYPVLSKMVTEAADKRTLL